MGVVHQLRHVLFGAMPSAPSRLAWGAVGVRAVASARIQHRDDGAPGQMASVAHSVMPAAAGAFVHALAAAVVVLMAVYARRVL